MENEDKITFKMVASKIMHFYDIAVENKAIRKPYSWAIYQTWKVINALEQSRDNKKD